MPIVHPVAGRLNAALPEKADQFRHNIVGLAFVHELQGQGTLNVAHGKMISIMPRRRVSSLGGWLPSAMRTILRVSVRDSPIASPAWM